MEMDFQKLLQETNNLMKETVTIPGGKEFPQYYRGIHQNRYTPDKEKTREIPINSLYIARVHLDSFPRG
ncbi:hypothetical protein SK128_000778 [Halocaridina rubra]|uniref:Uncharacterized protein n=1 Tax=Halocaridina rubra TaxID=373956 RepID=A0AAN8XA63_HALRR